MTPTERVLQARVDTLERENASLRAENARLREALEAAQRTAKRQAAPFSRNQPTANPKRPGRKAGAQYGAQAQRPIPARVDETIPVPVPATCTCGGPVVPEDTCPQFQEDIVRRTVVRRFDVGVGTCRRCGRRVQGRHPLQTSDARGVGQVQVGPDAIALATQLTKGLGVSHGKAATVLRDGYGLTVSRSGLCRAIQRLGTKAAPTYDALVQATQTSLLVWIDETGWRVGGRLQWLWVAVSEQATVFAIQPGRGFDQAAALLGAEYEGILHHDGWRSYYTFPRAFHQSCIAHVVRRCEELITRGSRAAAWFPQAVLDLVQRGLALRDRCEAGTITPHGLAVATGRLDAALGRLLARPVRTPENRRLAKHLDHERPHLFTFLHCPGVHATNNVAERALRPAICARKTWGGNRTARGARTQQILVSVITTCRQQGRDVFAALVALLRAPRAEPLDLVPRDAAPP